MTINLESSIDTYLYLRDGEARSGAFRLENDDVVSGNTNSQIVATALPAGKYTIEATTYDADKTGAFTLTVSGLGGSGGGTPPSDTCGETITANGAVTGTWAAGCDSAVSGRGHATRYYTFELTQASDVTITLESTIDTYLYLRGGEAKSGTALHENDDIVSGNTNSQIVATALPAGKYTIEATTYDADKTGVFTLTVSGLGGSGGGTPPSDNCTSEITADGTVTGSWAAGCDSAVSGRGHARYYTFELAQASDVTITLESTIDTYLYLRQGEAKSGTALHENDDIVSGNTNSRIQETLAAGEYTIEATTYDENKTGNFTLTVSGLSGGGGTPPSDTCGDTITADDAVSGTWAAGCDSAVSGRGHARYYTFELAQAGNVTITLESTIDTYLYLRGGEAKSGTALHENDDIVSGNTNSRIQETLAAGKYTIEATTYEENKTGGFTLTVSGLSGGGGTPPSDTCGDTITADGVTSGTWAAGCDSAVSGRGHARYYTFDLAQQSSVTITLESSIDTYLYLRQGEAKSGTALHENDDIVSGNTNSRIQETLAAGKYTIEATTYDADKTGGFTLTVSGLSGGGTGPAPDTCGDTIDADGAVSGTWAAGCDSAVSGRGHARYYTFELAQAGNVTITLESSIDTYLYLRDGEARSGAFRLENDDVVSGNTNSQIVATALPAGKYTIEATTYDADKTGGFTLTVSGLSD